MNIKRILVLLSVLFAVSVNAAVTQVSVLSFGAKGDGVTDDTTAVQNWLSWSGNPVTKGGLYYAPKGIYVCTANIVLPRWGTVYGDGGGINDTGNGTTFLFPNGHGFVHAYDGANNHEFDHFALRDMSVYMTSAVGTGLRMKNSHEFNLENLRIYGGQYGVTVEDCWDLVMNNVQAGASALAGCLLTNLVTDATFINAQFSNNNGYGLLVNTPDANRMQMIRFVGGSLQYNQLGNWWNGGLACVIDNAHFEGSLGPDIMLGSATNRCTSFEIRNNHHDWSDAQYDGAVALWPTGSFCYYQIVLSNAWNVSITDEHANLANTPAKNRAAIYASALCRNITVGDGSSFSSYLQPYYIGEVPPNNTARSLNLLQNGLFLRDERNPNNFPYTWISDYPHSDPSFTSGTLAGLLGYTYSGNLTNLRSLYTTNQFQLKTNTYYTHSTMIQSGAGERTLIRIVDRASWNGGSNDVTQTINVITNTGRPLYVVSRFFTENIKTNPYIFATAYEAGKQVVTIGGQCLVEGMGVGCPQLSDSYFPNRGTNQWAMFASDTPNQGYFRAGDIVYNDYSVDTNCWGWQITATGNPPTAIPLGGIGILPGTAGYFPRWSATSPLLSATSSMLQDGTGNVIIGTNTLITLDVSSVIRVSGAGANRPRLGLSNPGWGDWTWYMNADGSLNLLNTAEAVNIMNWSQAGDVNINRTVNITGDLTVSGDISAPSWTVNTVFAGTTYSTNGVVYLAAATGPAAATIGAGNAAIWASNSVPAQLYVRTTTDGIAVVDTPFP